MSNKPARHTLSLKSHTPPSAAPAEPEPVVYASAYVLADPFGFVTDWGATYFKPAGSLITHGEEIAILMARGAPLEEV